MRPDSRRAASATALVLCCAACGGPPPPARPAPDLILRNGAIYTVDARRSWASAMAIAGGEIVAVGDDSTVSALAAPGTKVVDLGGRFVLPGFHDAHVHPLGAGVELGQCNLNDKPTAEATLATIRTCVTEQQSRPWLVGGGWDLTAFPGGNPGKASLDVLVGDKPAYLSSADGHSAWVSSAALRAAGVTRATADPPSGRVERDAAGEPSGVLRESAMNLVGRLVPPPTPDEQQAGLVRAVAVMNGFGIVAFQEARAEDDVLEAYRAVARRQALTARVRISLFVDPSKDASQVGHLVELRKQTTEAGLNANTAKIFIDGVLESTTAAVLEPYVPLPKVDGPGGHDSNPLGLAKFEPARLSEVVTRLDAAGFQVHMHAIGDRAVRMGLDAVAAARAANGARDARHHIAHVELVDPTDLGRFRTLGVVATIQPLWAFADSYITDLTEPRLGPARSRWLYPFRSLLEQGATLAGGSDWSVSSVNPLEGIQVAVTRRSLTAAASDPAWLPDERLELPTAIAAYTAGAAYVSFDDRSGSIEAGKRADYVVLDRNLFEMAPETIHTAKVLWTVLEGREVFRAPGFDPAGASRP